ncbi:unnamed protein product [Polarella glacialis]|uniref:NADP-dependent oxidoreductase domain-containing protein n=1 Tax=Polarella glacialis TaxID=89957 RepID=A0A813KAG6_POLGL|nr:unnamed protein product [Polarella glacialis]
MGSARRATRQLQLLRGGAARSGPGPGAHHLLKGAGRSGRAFRHCPAACLSGGWRGKGPSAAADAAPARNFLCGLAADAETGRQEQQQVLLRVDVAGARGASWLWGRACHRRRGLSGRRFAGFDSESVEWHLGFHQDALQSWCQARNITVQARSALGFESSGALHPAAELLEAPAVLAAARSHHVSAEQVALRWSLQRTVPVIIAPRLQHQLMDDLAPLVNFTLTHEEMEALSTLQSTALVV